MEKREKEREGSAGVKERGGEGVAWEKVGVVV